jgi:hypothetical protein
LADFTNQETDMARCYITVEFTRDLGKDKKAGINPLSSVTLEGVLRNEYGLEELTVTDQKILSTSKYRVMAELPIYPEQGDSVSTLLAYRLLELQRQAIKGRASFDFVVANISLSEMSYSAGDVLNSMSESRTLEFSKLQIATEDGVTATKDWLMGLVTIENKSTATVVTQINRLLALMEPSINLHDGDDPSQEPGFTNRDLAIRNTLRAHAPKILETISNHWIKFSARAIWQELALVKERLKRLNHLHLSLPQNYEVDGEDITALVDKFANSDEATITDQVIRDLLDQHDPNSTEGRAFRRGLLVASQLALETTQRRKGTASVELLHSDLTSRLAPQDTRTM